MSRSHYGHSTLSGLVESDSEDATLGTFDAQFSFDSSPENAVIPKKGRQNQKAVSGKVMKAKASGRRVSATRAATAKKAKRAPLSDRTNEQDGASDTEEVDEFEQQDDSIDRVLSGDELDASVVAVKQRKPASSKPKAGHKVGRTTDDISRHTSIDRGEPPEPVQARGVAPTKKQSHSRHQPATRPQQRNEVIQETQISAMDVEDYEDEDIQEPTPKPVARYTSVPRATSQSHQASVQRHRAGSASDTERTDPAIRRKLGELTKKYENLDLKYRNIREIGVKDAENNFERLRKQSEESKKAANAFIASLKAELATQKSQAKESRDLKALNDAQAVKISALEAKVSQLTSSLSDAHIENKTLSARLAANRHVSVESTSNRMPGSAVKANGGIRMMGSAEVAQAAQTAQLKENLYSDLTGLIIRDVKRERDDDVYDCIQTGRNGTLHFKLAVANERSAESYDDAHCIYIPQLDPSRDEALMEQLQDYDYLVEEITFPRPHSVKFYTRLLSALTEKKRSPAVVSQ